MIFVAQKDDSFSFGRFTEQFNTMKKSLFILLLVSASNLNAQLKELKMNKELVDSLFFADQVSGLEVSERMLPLAFQSEDTFYITYFLDQAGELNRMLGNYDKALNQLHKCLTYKKNWEDLQDLSLTYNNIGKTYIDKGLYDLAAQNFLKALELMEEDENYFGQGYYLNNLGALYDLQRNYSKAIEYYERSLRIKKILKDTKGIGSTHTNLGISLYNLGNNEGAVKAFSKSISIFKELNIPTKVARALSNQAKAYLALGDYDLAGKCLKEAYGIDLVDEPQLAVQLSTNLSEYYATIKNTDSALYFNSKALSLAKKINGFKALRDSYRQRAGLLSSLDQKDSALFYLETSIRYDDSLLNEANIYAVAEMEGKYNYEKNLRTIKEKELNEAKLDGQLKAKRVQQLVLLLIIVLVGGLAFIWYRRYRENKQNNELLQGQNKLISQRSKDLEKLNQRLESELDTLQLSIEEKQKLLNSVFADKEAVELPEELLSLSKREMEVLCYLALGRTDEQIAQGLFVSKSTVKTHLRRVYSKLLVSGRAEAVAIAHKYELLGRE
jgi:tetratricopeptide (TPR) repeat protein